MKKMKPIKENKEFDLDDYLNDEKVLLYCPDIFEQYQKSKITDCVIKSIADDYYTNINKFNEIAIENLTRIIKFEDVLFVKHRIKTLYSLLTKIIVNKNEYGNIINQENYFHEITDLIGFRILYLFKSDYLSVHNQIMHSYAKRLTEDVKVKLKEGDDESIYKDIDKKIIEKNKSYRSIHYVARSLGDDDNCPRMEIQTRTIYEEAWSEMNHQLLYKKYYPEDKKKRLNDLSNHISSLTGVCDMLGEFMLHYTETKIPTKKSYSLEKKHDLSSDDFELGEIWSDFIDST